MEIVNAIVSDDYQSLKTLISTQKTKDYALQRASEHGKIKLVKYLVRNGAGVNDDCLSYACANCHLEVVKYIHGLGFDKSRNFARYAASHESGLKIIKFLHEKGIDIHLQNDKAFEIACQFGRLDTVKYLFEHGTNINGSGLQLASECGKFDTVHFLLKNGATYGSWVAALRACDNGYFDICNLLLDYNVEMHSIPPKLMRYRTFAKKMMEKKRVKAVNTIGTWWIPICYDLSRECGKRMAEKSWKRVEAMFKEL